MDGKCAMWAILPQPTTATPNLAIVFKLLYLRESLPKPEIFGPAGAPKRDALDPFGTKNLSETFSILYVQRRTLHALFNHLRRRHPGRRHPSGLLDGAESRGSAEASRELRISRA